MDGVQYFLSCITSVMSNAKRARDDENETTLAKSYPGIAHFVIFKECETCNAEILFSKVHNQDLDAEISHIRVRKGANSEMATAAKQLFQVVKDHNNREIQEMLENSNRYCYTSFVGTSDEDPSESENEIDFTHFPKVCMYVCI